MYTFSGGTLTIIGLYTSSYAQSLHFLYLSFSATVGLGLGLTFMPAIEIVSQYYREKPTVPLGLAVSGNGVGMLMFPGLNE